MTHETRNDISDERLEAMLAELEIEQAPASLTRRLNRIPEEQSRRGWKWPWQWSLAPAPRWAMAPAFAAVPSGVRDATPPSTHQFPSILMGGKMMGMLQLAMT